MVDYIATQTAIDAASAHGNRYDAKPGMVATFTQDLVDALIESFRPLPGYELYFNTCGGAVSRVAEDAAEDEVRTATLEDWWSAFELRQESRCSLRRAKANMYPHRITAPGYPETCSAGSSMAAVRVPARRAASEPVVRLTP